MTWLLILGVLGIAALAVLVAVAVGVWQLFFGAPPRDD